MLRKQKFNAPRPIIEMKKEYIEQAIRKNTHRCMIVKAIQEQVPEASAISVDLQTIRWSDRRRGLRYTFLTPRVAQQLLVLFDLGDKQRLEKFGPAVKFRLRGALVTSITRNEKGRRKLAHNLGRRRIAATKRDKKSGTVPEQIGGKPPPLERFHASHNSRREFGVRGFTMEDLVPEGGCFALEDLKDAS
jgi:hypothetical protein